MNKASDTQPNALSSQLLVGRRFCFTHHLHSPCCHFSLPMLPTQQNEDGSWRIRMNYEPNELIENADLVRFIKSRVAWLGHVMRMDDKRTPKRILEWKPIGARILRETKKEMYCRCRRRYANNGNKTVEKPM